MRHPESSSSTEREGGGRGRGREVGGIGGHRLLDQPPESGFWVFPTDPRCPSVLFSTPPLSPCLQPRTLSPPFLQRWRPSLQPRRPGFSRRPPRWSLTSSASNPQRLSQRPPTFSGSCTTPTRSAQTSQPSPLLSLAAGSCPRPGRSSPSLVTPSAQRRAYCPRLVAQPRALLRPPSIPPNLSFSTPPVARSSRRLAV